MSHQQLYINIETYSQILPQFLILSNKLSHIL